MVGGGGNREGGKGRRSGTVQIKKQQLKSLEYVCNMCLDTMDRILSGEDIDRGEEVVSAKRSVPWRDGGGVRSGEGGERKGNGLGGVLSTWWYIYVPRPRPPVHISTVVLELIHSMSKGRSKALLFIPYRSSARSGLGSFFKLENAQTFRSEIYDRHHSRARSPLRTVSTMSSTTWEIKCAANGSAW